MLRSGIVFDKDKDESWRGVAAIGQRVIRVLQRLRPIALVSKIQRVVSTLALGY